MQESSRTSVDNNRLLFQKNLKEMQQLLEKQHLGNLENFHEEVDRTDDSESLLSLDSLEAGEQNAICSPPSEPSLTASCDCAPCIPGKSQTGSDVSYAAQNTSKNVHLNNCQRNIDSQNTHGDLPTGGLLAKRNVLSLANDTEEEPPVPHRSRKKAAEFSTSGNQESCVNKAFPILQNRKEERNDSSSAVCSTLATGPSVFSSSKAWASPGSTPGERVQDLTQNQSFKMTPQKRSKSVQTSAEPTATSRILFPNQRCFSGNPSPADVVPKNRNVSTDFLKNTLGKVIERKEENIKSIVDIDQGSALLQDIPNASAACSVKKQNNKEEGKANVVETMSVVSDTELGFGTPAQHSTQKNNIYDRKSAKLVRSIFKKEAEAAVVNHGITFGARPVSAIRDSLELAKSKKKSAENTKSGRKLKWCDQINQIIVENNDSCYEESISERSPAQPYCVHTVSNAPCANPCMGAHPSNTTVTANRHEDSHIPKPNVNSAKSNKECTSLNMLMSAGFSFPKNVWMVSKHEASESPVSANNDNTHKENQHKNKAKVIRSPRPIRDQLCSVLRSHRGRGAAVRLQSATDGRATQGRMLAPQPPSAPGSKRGKTRASPAVRQPLPSSYPQGTATNGNSLSEGQAWLANQILNKGTPGSNESRTCSSEVATVLSTPRCSTSCEPLAKHSGCVSSCQHCSVTCTKQRASTESRSHHGHIPTAEETTVWKGARIALSPMDPAAGVTQHRMSHYNNSHATKRQPYKAVSCVPTGDGSQKTCFKVSSGMNKLGFFHANSVVPVTKQRQILNGFENKHGAFTEQGRKTVDSKRWKPTRHTQNLLRTIQLHPVQSAFDPAQNMNYTCNSEEVSESTAQFLMAEKLTNTAATEDEILAAMGSVQPARQPLLLNTAPRLGMSALSIEEEKIFQSLDRLNQRLKNVQEAIARNPSVSGILQKTTPFVSV
ncbi:centrosomal protein of 126 kDa [Excalfactoria chinensis]|uniref:centrosomal protein of 126 kDa n=1 Tax=Excalfactoria chinensis TaxID=46218 RepID=UPI003B3B9F18